MPTADDNENPITAHFVSEYNKRYGHFGFEITFASQDYDSVYLLADAFAACGANNECIKGLILDTKNRESAVGKLSFLPNGDPTYGLAISRIVNGKAVYEKIDI